MKHTNHTTPLRRMPIGAKGHVIHNKDLDDGGFAEYADTGVPSEADRICTATLINVDHSRQILEITCKCGEVIVVDCETPRNS